METSGTTKVLKASIRKKLRQHRGTLKTRLPDPNLRPGFNDLLQNGLVPSVIAGFVPIDSEINIWPLLHHLNQLGHNITLPVVTQPGHPLTFRRWAPECDMNKDRYGISYPAHGERLTPRLIFVPLLAFTAGGDRLGYGGGYYDRTLQALRGAGEVFACGVAYAGQEMAELPTDAYDQRLDGILTETGFRTFT